MKLATQRFFLVLVAIVSFLGCAGRRPPILKAEDYTARKNRPVVRVACVGDSITYGAGVENWETNNYPAVLSQFLGSSFEVGNFGRSGATVSKLGDSSYWTSHEFTRVTEDEPDVVILMLGTNDTKPENWRGPKAFTEDFRALLDHFAKVKSKPRLWVCLPVPVYKDNFGINATVLNEGVIPSTLQVCNERKIPVIDMNDAMSRQDRLFPDGIHPNAAGARLLAKTIYQAIRP